MSDIRVRVADALCNRLADLDVSGCRYVADNLADTLLALPGIAIVETGQDSVAEAIYEAHRVVYGDVCWSRWAALGEIGRDTYRRMAAAALLASAAQEQEAGQ